MVVAVASVAAVVDAVDAAATRAICNGQSMPMLASGSLP